MYEKYHTQGIVLGAFDRGESDRVCRILTPDLGLVYVQAKSVREEGAKLRAGLELYAHSDISCIRARDVWKVTDSVLRINMHNRFASEGGKQRVVKRVVGLLNQLAMDEGDVTNLFLTIVEGIDYLRHVDLSSENIAGVEALIVSRVLHTLGYLRASGWYDHIVISPFVSDVVVAEAARVRKPLVRAINDSLTQMQW